MSVAVVVREGALGGVVVLTADWSAGRAHAPSGLWRDRAARPVKWLLCCAEARLRLPLYRSHDIDTGWEIGLPMKTPATVSASFSIRPWT